MRVSNEWMDCPMGAWEHPSGEDAGMRDHPNHKQPPEEFPPCWGAPGPFSLGLYRLDIQGGHTQTRARATPCDRGPFLQLHLGGRCVGGR